jgi:hypothetical protein
MATVRSKDGTTIAYERSGDGPAIVLIDGAAGVGRALRRRDRRGLS